MSRLYSLTGNSSQTNSRIRLFCTLAKSERSSTRGQLRTLWQQKHLEEILLVYWKKAKFEPMRMEFWAEKWKTRGKRRENTLSAQFLNSMNKRYCWRTEYILRVHNFSLSPRVHWLVAASRQFLNSSGVRWKVSALHYILTAASLVLYSLYICINGYLSAFSLNHYFRRLYFHRGFNDRTALSTHI